MVPLIRENMKRFLLRLSLLMISLTGCSGKDIDDFFKPKEDVVGYTNGGAVDKSKMTDLACEQLHYGATVIRYEDRFLFTQHEVYEFLGLITPKEDWNNDQTLYYGWKTSEGCCFASEDEEVMVLHTLTVAPEWTGYGFAKKFVYYYEEYAKNCGCHYLRMDTNAKNKAARNLYAGLGYCESGIVPCEFNGIPDVQLVCLEKSLA